MAVSLGSDGNEMSEINVTPLVDVMLVLLVIFMVTAPMIQQQVDVDLPETTSKSATMVKENDVVLTLDKKKNILIGKVPVPLKGLSSKLREIYRTKSKKEIYMRADKTIPYGFVVKVMAEVKNGGIDRMGMITESESGE